MCGQLGRYEAAAAVFVLDEEDVDEDVEEDDEEPESDEVLLLSPPVEEPDVDLAPFEDDDFEDSERESFR